MSLTRVHHVGMVVHSLDAARHVYTDGFGMGVDEDNSSPETALTTPFGPVNRLIFPIGELFLEVNQPTDPGSTAAQFLAERGNLGGMHYVSFASDRLQQDVETMLQRGMRLLLPPDRKDWDGASPVFFDPATAMGLLLQVAPDDPYYPHPAYRGEGVFTGMAHVGLAAADVDATRKFWGDLMGLPEDTSRVRGNEQRERPRDSLGPTDDVHIREFPIGGTIVEISHPNDQVSGTARFVQQRAALGAAYHHICPWAPDVHRSVDMGRAAGLQQIGGIPPREVSRRATAWFHPKSCLGTLMEIWNRPVRE